MSLAYYFRLIDSLLTCGLGNVNSRKRKATAVLPVVEEEIELAPPPTKKAKKGRKASKADALPEPASEVVAAGGSATIVVKPLQLDSAAAIGRYVAEVIERNLEMLKSMLTAMSPEPVSNIYNLCAKAMRHLFEERPKTSRT